jgi:hypothetical protein
MHPNTHSTEPPDWLAALATAVDGLAAQGVRAGSTAGSAWSPPPPAAASGSPGPLFRGPLTATARALTDGELSLTHARVLAHGIQDLPAHLVAEAEPVLVGGRPPP